MPGEGVKKTVPVIISVACFVLEVVIFVFAEGLRAVYSGLFFLVLGRAAFIGEWRRARKKAP